MKNQITILLLVVTGLFCHPSFGQYTNDVSVNTAVSTLNDDVTGIKAATTPSGKTYVAYLDGYFKLKLQLLDANGYKVFPPAGIVLDSASTSYSLASTTDIIFDEQENAIIAFANWVEDSVRLFVVSPSGNILDKRTCGSGYLPKLEMLADHGFVLAFSKYDSTTVLQKKSFSGIAISSLWSSLVYNQCQDLLALPNGNFYIVSYSLLPYPGYAYTFANLINGSNGNAIWANWAAVSSFDNSSLYTAPVSCNTDGNKNLYVSNTYFENVTYRRAYAQKIDTTGSAQWGANGKLISDTTASTYHQRVITLFNASANELSCIVQEDIGLYFQRISTSGTLVLSPAGIPVVVAAPGQLFGAKFCGTDIAFAYIGDADSHVYVCKILGTGYYTYYVTAINTTSNTKSWVDATMCDVHNSDIIVVFQENRISVSSAFAQKMGCDGSFTNAVEESHDAIPVNIYPNPNNGNFYIDLPAGYKDIEFTITDITGRIMLIKKIQGDDGMLQMNFDAPSGLYFLSFTDSSGRLTAKKLIKE